MQLDPLPGQAELFDPLDCDVNALLERMDALDPETAKHAWPKGLADMVDVSATHLARAGHSAEASRAICRLVIAALADYMGGRVYYLPRDDRLRIALRNNMIWAEFTGHNTKPLADKHDMTPMQIGNIIKEQRRLHVGRVQGRLFGTEQEKNHANP